MPSEKIELPPMPEPTKCWPYEPVDGTLFTADQMTAYALLAVKQERELLAKLAAEMDCAHRCGVGHELAAVIQKRDE